MRARIHPFLIARGAPIALSAALGAVGVACSLTTSLDGLTTEGGADAGSLPPSEAGPLGAEGGSSDAGGDGGTDGGGVDAAPKPFLCADQAGAAFCADFEADPFTTGWHITDTVAGGALTTAEGRFGRGLWASTPSHDATTKPGASLESSNLPLAPRQDFTFSLDTKIGSLQGGQTDFVGFNFHGPFYIVTLRGEGNGKVDLYEYADPLGSTPALDHYQMLLAQPTIGSWIHIVGHVTFGAASVHLELTFDGVTAFDGELGASPYAGPVYVHAGITQSVGDSNPVTIVFDDLLVTSP